MLIRRYILFIILLSSFTGFAQNTRILFSENKNQWPSQVLYRTPLYDGYMYAESTCLTYYFSENNKSAHSHGTGNFDVKNFDFTKTYAAGDTVIPLIHADEETLLLKSHSYKVFFKNMNKRMNVSAEDKLPGIENYYHGNDPKKWGQNVGVYQSITYNNIYKNIDLHMYDGGGTLKYDFIIAPGGNVNDIELVYTGIPEMLITDKGDLEIKTSVNKVYEKKPYAYQKINNEIIIIPCEYKLKYFTLSYSIGDYNKDYPLYIDPNLIFSTYTGSTADNWGFTATYDNNDNVYSGGTVYGVGYPSTIGAAQENYSNGDWDVGIIKYDPTGKNRLYATYLGGEYAEMPHSLIVNSNNELLILGTTGSSDFPMINSYNATFQGGDNTIYDRSFRFQNGCDMFIAKLSADGTSILGSTFLGGTENDGLNYSWETNDEYGHDSLYYNYGDGARGEIMVDANNNVYVASTTFSNDFPMVNAAQATSGGSQDAVILKMNPDLSVLEWSSYFGGISKDAAYSIDVDITDGVYVCGGTCSPTNPLPAGGFMSNRPGGIVDAFVLKFNQNTGALENGTYFGSPNYDQAHFVRVNQAGDVFIFGQTTATGSTLIYNAVYNKPNSGQFLASFGNDLSTLNWSTVFGTGVNRPNIAPTAFEVDICNRIYLAGQGREWAEGFWVSRPDLGPGMFLYNAGWGTVQGTKNMDITPDAEYPVTDGKDFYIMVMDDDANNLNYSTFFGEQFDNAVLTYNSFTGIVNYVSGCPSSGRDHVDGGTSRFDSKGYIYQSVCASCGGCNGFPIKPNDVWSPINGAENCNNAVMRFYIDFGLLNANFDLPEVSCSSQELEFTNTSEFHYNDPQIKYTWDFGDGSPISNETNPKHLFPGEGTYTIRLTVEDSSACNLHDFIKKDLRIVFDTKTETLETKHICQGEVIEIGIPNDIDPDLTYEWSPTTDLDATNTPSANANPSTPTNYTLIVSEGWCKTIYKQFVDVHINDYRIIDIEATVNNSFKNPICQGETVTLNAITSDDSYRYIWSTSPNFYPVINPDFTLPSITITPDNSSRYYVRTFSRYCMFSDTASIYLQVTKNNITAFGDDTICKGGFATIEVQNLIPENTPNYTWQPTNLVSSGQGTAKPVVRPSKTTDFIVYAQIGSGCIASDTVRIFVDEVRINTYFFDQISCYGETDAKIFINPTGFPNYTISWENGSSSQLRDNLTAGEYTATVTDSLGCIGDSTFVIIEPDTLVIIDTTNSFCTCISACNGSIYAHVTGGTEPYIYNWSNGSTEAYNNNLCQGNYSLSITDKHGCTTTMNEPVEIGIFEKLPFLDATANPSNVFLGLSTNLQARPNAPDSIEYVWNPYLWIENQKGANIIATPESSITYYVKASDEYGCSNIDTVEITVHEWNCGQPFIFVPTAFSPNNDDKNDIFKIESSVITELKFEVFDRWGEKVFETNDVTKSWDGSYRGKALEPQVLVYYIVATCINQEVYSEQGNITIIK